MAEEATGLLSATALAEGGSGATDEARGTVLV